MFTMHKKFDVGTKIMIVTHKSSENDRYISKDESKIGIVENVEFQEKRAPGINLDFYRHYIRFADGTIKPYHGAHLQKVIEPVSNINK